MATVTGTDWLAVCRRAIDAVRAELRAIPTAAERAVPTGRGQGGDTTLVVDRTAEDAIFRELEALAIPLTVVSEERGRVELHGGGTTHVVVDPIDGSRNAKRALPGYSVSIAVAQGPALADVVFGCVHDLVLDETWHAAAGEGAFLDGQPLAELGADQTLEMLALEMTEPGAIAVAADSIAASGAERVRALGSLALSLCWVAGGRYDGLAALSQARTVDFAAAALMVTEAGGAVALPDVRDQHSAELYLTTRTRICAAPTAQILERVQAIAAR